MISLAIILSECPVQAIIYDIGDKSLREVNRMGKILSAKDSLLINFCNSDERILVQAGIPTISMRTFLSMCCGYVVKEDEVNRIFNRTIGIHYANIFCNKQIDFSILYSSPRFWNRVATLVLEGMDILETQVCK
ncbi:MAG: hypothetical protein NC341_10390 [Blautia sp.]|nr:hypothetical protein [Blautia sp.]MCM1201615.1 hypothetical protein [Bacteroides fragilis]